MTRIEDIKQEVKKVQREKALSEPIVVYPITEESEGIEWQVFGSMNTNSSIPQNVLQLSISKSLVISWNIKSQQCLDYPQFVYVVSNVERNYIGIRKTASKTGRPLKVSHTSKTRWGVNAASIFKHIGIDIREKCSFVDEEVVNVGNIIYVDITNVVETIDERDK